MILIRAKCTDGKDTLCEAYLDEDRVEKISCTKWDWLLSKGQITTAVE